MLLGVACGCGRGPFWDFIGAETVRCDSVDFLYVIDNSDSMRTYQQNLRASFGPFIEGMRTTLDDVDDYHVGVVTTDAYLPNTECRELGALVTHTGGIDSSSSECGPFAEGERYMTEQDDLEAAFNCTAAVGTSGSPNERPMEALSLALDSSLSPPVDGIQSWWQRCNGGFVRDDAVLVTVLITDEWDGPDDPTEDPETESSESSLGTPQDWFDTVVGVKGREQNAVVVSLLSEADTGCSVGDPAFDGRHIGEFTRMFTHGFVGGICSRDYGATFERAIQEIDAACDAYTLVDPGVVP